MQQLAKQSWKSSLLSARMFGFGSLNKDAHRLRFLIVDSFEVSEPRTVIANLLLACTVQDTKFHELTKRDTNL